MENTKKTREWNDSVKRYNSNIKQHIDQTLINSTFVILLIAVIALSIFIIFHPLGLIKGISDILSQKDILGKMWISLMMIVMIAIGTYLFLCTKQDQ